MNSGSMKLLRPPTFSRNEDDDVDDEEVEQELVHKLAYKWDFWAWVGDLNVDWKDCLKKQCTMETIEDYVALKHRILLPSKLPTHVDYYIFKHGVEPDYVNEANKQGGMFYALIPSEHKYTKLDNLWQALLMAVLGGQFYEGNANIVGFMVGSRVAASKIAIWLRDANNYVVNKEIRGLMAQILGIEDDKSLMFRRHSRVPLVFK